MKKEATQIKFPHAGEAFSAFNAAEKWCQANGYSVGRMQGPAPIGIVRGDADISKWRNMTTAERNAMDGTITFDGFPREANATVTIF